MEVSVAGLFSRGQLSFRGRHAVDELRVGAAELGDRLDAEVAQARARWRDVQTPSGPVAALLPPGSWQHGAPRMDAVPSLGQHTDEILRRYGYSDERIAELRAHGVV